MTSSEKVPKISGDFNSNVAGKLTETSLVDSSTFVDTIRQQDSSNQSGTSDSGLGYTNSISSDNSSSVVGAIGISTQQANKLVNNGTSSAGSGDILAGRNINNRIKSSPAIANNSYTDLPRTDINNNNNNTTTCRPSATTPADQLNIKQNSDKNNNNDHNDDDVVLLLAPGLSSNQGTRNDMTRSKNTISTTDKDACAAETGTRSANGYYKLDNEAKVRHSTGDSPTISKATPIPTNDSEYEVHSSSARISNNELVSIPKSSSASNVPALKSALKRTSPKSVNVPSKSTRHNRTVSFNQTVIVFCEEYETSSPSDQCDPPLDYQEGSQSDRYESPESSCDLGLDNQKAEATHDDLEIFSKIVSGNVSSLTDDQLFESILRSCNHADNDYDDDGCDDDDYDASDDEFTLDRLNSNQSYLCHNAISDSDSESTAAVTEYRRPDDENQDFRKFNESSARLSDQGRDSKQAQLVSSNDIKSLPSEATHKNLMFDQNGSQAEHNHDAKLKINQTQQRSMPARMKVSPVDANHSRRQPTVSNSKVDDHDLKSKSKTVVQNSSNTLSAHSENPTKLFPMIIKQSNVGPVALSKSNIVRNPTSSLTHQREQPAISASRNSATELEYSAPQPTNALNVALNKSSTSRIHHQASNQDQLIQTQNEIQQRQNQINIVPNIKAQVVQNRPACHICRAIESNRTQTMAINVDATKNLTPPTAAANQRHQVGQAQPNQYHANIVAPSQPVVLNPACASCRESSMQHANAVRSEAQTIAGQSARPIAYQLVYVVDQNGNRVRALQVVSPRAPNLMAQQGRQVLIAPTNGRFPNPLSLVGQQYVRLPVAGPVVSAQGSDQQRTQNAAQYNLTVDQNQLSNQVHVGSNYTSNQTVGQPLRNHTVYYVRQPLGVQTIRHSIDAADPGARSFPDPHEIRRLDGLKGPASGLSLSQLSNINQPVRITTTAHQVAKFNQRQEDPDDPTFGFSKRPSVKVVATSVNQPQNMQQGILKPKQCTATSRAHINHGPVGVIESSDAHNKIDGSMRPVSVVVLGSQTLDRRINNRNQQSQASGRENAIPSTSSMSNINETLSSFPDRFSVSINRRQQQRILVNKTAETNNLESKGTISNSNLRRWLKNLLTNPKSSPVDDSSYD